MAYVLGSILAFFMFFGAAGLLGFESPLMWGFIGVALSQFVLIILSYRANLDGD